MCNRLSVQPFGTHSLALPEVQSFDCGTAVWALTINDWIRSGDAISNMRTRGTKVWLYYECSILVGYGSLGTTTWPILFPKEPKKPVLILPSLGVQTASQQKGFGKLICEHLIEEAQSFYRERLEKASPIAPLLGLLVHPDNHAAKSLYKSVGFSLYDYFYDDKDDGIRYEGMAKLLDSR
jgi:GNAT superfamily N-acetyltransferase